MESMVNNSNRLPGSEKLTRPEDIKGLSRFLKKVKSDNQDLTESTMKNSPGLLDIIPGVNTGKIPVEEVRNTYGRNQEYIDRAPGRMGELPEELPGSVKQAPGRLGSGMSEKIGLPGPRIPGVIPSIPSIPSVSSVEDIDKDEELPKIQETYIELPDGRKRVSDLGKSKETIEDIRETKLETFREDLSIDSIGPLGNRKISIGSVSSVETLSTSREDLELDKQPVSLGRKSVGLHADTEIYLGEKVVSLKGTSGVEIIKKKVSLDADLDTGIQSDIHLVPGKLNNPILPDSIVDLELISNGVESLPGKLESISLGDSEEVVSLETRKVDISDIKDTSLSKSVQNIPGNKISPDLAKSTVGLSVPGVDSLGKKRIDFSDDSDNTLPDKVVDLVDLRDNILEDTRESVPEGMVYPELPGDTVDLVDDSSFSLPEKRLSPDGETPETFLGSDILEGNRISSENLGTLSGNVSRLLEIAKNSPGGYWKLNNIPETPLEDERIGLSVPGIDSLGKKRIDFSDDTDNTLPGIVKTIDPDYPDSLSDTKIPRPGPDTDSELPDKRLGILDPRENNLEDAKEKVPGPRDTEPDLPDFILTTPSGRDTDPDMPDFVLTPPGDYEYLVEPGKTKTNLPGEPVDPEVGRKIVTIKDDLEEELSGKLVHRPGHNGPGKKEKLDDILNSEEALTELLKNPDYNDVFNKVISALRNDKEFSDLSDKVASFISSRLDPNKAISPGSREAIILERNKVLSLVSANYFKNPRREFVPDYKIEFNDPTSIIDPSKYVRKIAETTAQVFSKKGGFWSGIKEKVVKETLLMLLDARDLLRKNVAGNDPSTLPMRFNRPGIGAFGEKLDNLVVGNNRELLEPPTPKKFSPLEVIVDKLTGIDISGTEDRPKFDLKERYFSSRSFKQTLKELCLTEETPGTLDDLKALIESSPYISTPTKFGTIRSGEYGTTTLDTNNNWEVVFEPFVDKEMNGGYSFLPDIREMNMENLITHGVKTGYGKYMPFNSFELQKSKIITKPLEIFEGEISYPVGVELTNELRFTVVDDSLKTWRRYFERCMEVSVYSSQPHETDYYLANKVDEEFIPTAIDKNNFCVALYKNVTFRVRIYVLSSQLNTVRKFDLLCVLKDFSEDYSGDVDSSGNDISVSFSIVGENPTLSIGNKSEKVKFSKKKKRKVVLRRGVTIKKVPTAALKAHGKGASMIKVLS